MQKSFLNPGKEKLYINSFELEELEDNEQILLDIDRIKEHFYDLKSAQQELIADINLPLELKERFFVFSKDYYIETKPSPVLHIFNHPVKGKLILEDSELKKMSGYREAAENTHILERIEPNENLNNL